MPGLSNCTPYLNYKLYLNYLVSSFVSLFLKNLNTQKTAYSSDQNSQYSAPGTAEHETVKLCFCKVSIQPDSPKAGAEASTQLYATLNSQSGYRQDRQWQQFLGERQMLSDLLLTSQERYLCRLLSVTHPMSSETNKEELKGCEGTSCQEHFAPQELKFRGIVHMHGA